MSSPPIMPLAQRLAEENNVDWRSLSGSGEGGRVVEDDVLAYLAQVMLGHAAADPTPEPLPEGLSAWPEEVATRRQHPPQTSTDEVAGGKDQAANSAYDEDSPWTLELPSVSPNPQPNPLGSGEPHESSDGPDGLAAGQAFSFLSAPSLGAPSDPDDETRCDPSDGYRNDERRNTEHGEVHAQQRETAPRGDRDAFNNALTDPAANIPTPLQPISQATSQADTDEVKELRSRVAELEDERAHHLDELHQLARLQETIDAQKAEKARGEALQRELRAVTGELAQARSEAERVAPLEAKLHNLEERLSRARLFKTKAKDELGRLSTLVESLQGELETLKKRRWWKMQSK